MRYKKNKNIFYKKNLNKIVYSFNNTFIRRFFAFLTITACIVFSLAFLYQPAKNYYIGVRENDKLQAQYEAIKKTNDNLSNDIDQLQTEDGIKQKAADNLGLIQQGESIGVVNGADINEGYSNGISSTSSKLAYKNIKTPQK